MIKQIDMQLSKKAVPVFFCLAFCVVLGCSSNKNISYFRDIPDSLLQHTEVKKIATFRDPVILQNDLLQVSIATGDKEDNELLAAINSTPVTPASSASGMQATAQGFLVDREGVIELPVIGKVKVAGLTTAEARDTIHARVARYYRQPVVNVRFANFKITVLGEVLHPGVFTVPGEKVSIIDAIGMAGDLTIDAKRENVLLVRDSLGHKQFTRFNLNASSVFTSPFYYLRQGDVIYVDPKRSKANAGDIVKIRNYTLIGSVLTVLVVLLTRN